LLINVGREEMMEEATGMDEKELQSLTNATGEMS
jgi:hypothetical protein